MRDITPEERNVIDKLAEAFNAFVKLPILHPMEREEFCHAIHAAQTIVMARPVQQSFNEEPLKTFHSEKLAEPWQEKFYPAGCLLCGKEGKRRFYMVPGITDLPEHTGRGVCGYCVNNRLGKRAT